LWQAIISGFTNLIQWLYEVTAAVGLPSYGLAIILVTVIIKIVLYPLTNKQLKSMRQMQHIQPRMKAVQERYKDDPERMQKEIMELYKRHGVNPLSGCLPLLVQLPILMAFYRALFKLTYTVPEHAAFLWVPDLAQRDPYFGFAVLAGLTTFIQQKVSTVDANDPTQKTMLYTMPLFLAWLAGTLPAGLALYWVAFNTLSIIQQLWVNYRLSLQEAAPVEVTMEEVEEEGALAVEGVEEENRSTGDKGGKKANADRRKKRKKRR
jgi:YidC/Oxa1 family membrane protein insertase